MLVLNPVGTVLPKMAADKNRASPNFPSVMIVCTQRLLLAKPVERLTQSLSL